MGKCTRCGANAGFMFSLCQPCIQALEAERLSSERAPSTQALSSKEEQKTTEQQNGSQQPTDEMNSSSMQKPTSASGTHEHQGTFFASCIIVGFIYAIIFGRFPGAIQGLVLVVPVIIVKALLDTIIDSFSPNGKKK